MIKEEREQRILSLLEERGGVSLRTIQRACSDVSLVTLRRDLARLERDRRLRRTHGGAVRIQGAAGAGGAASQADAGSAAAEFDALILPPVKGAWGHTLRQQSIRRGSLLIAESAPQVGGVYLGPRNFEGSRALGRFAAVQAAQEHRRAEVLLVALEGLQNTRDRIEGFREGFRQAFPGEAVFHRVDGRGLLKEVIRQVSDAFQAHPGIDIVFGVNDHTILGALEVAQRLGGNVAGYSVGGEGPSLFDPLAAGGALKAVLALFPEVVGNAAVDMICSAFDGRDIGHEIITPAEILTRGNLADFYTQADGQWHLIPAVLEKMSAPFAYKGDAGAGRSIGFMLHYPSHEWYRSLATAMRKRAAELGATLVSRNAEDEVASEIRAIKRKIGSVAAATVENGETLLIDGGECSRYFAEALRAGGVRANVYTNSLAVLEILAEAPSVGVFLTGGEYQKATRLLVGPSVGTLLETIRVDRAIISPDGIAPAFGLSFEDERAALVCRRFCAAARKVAVLADHGVVGLESRVQALRTNSAHAVFTDVGTLSTHRLDLSAAGMSVIVVDEGEEASRPGLPQEHRQAAS